MSIHRKNLLTCATALVCLLTVQGCGDGNSKGKQEVTIGAMLPLTGDVANWGQDTMDGINLALEEANKTSEKYHFRVISEDSKGSEKDGALAARKLISVDKVPVIIGDNVSGPTMAAAPIADKNKVVLLSPSASTPKLSGVSEYFFRIYPSDTAEGSFMADAAYRKLSLRNVAVMYINNDFGVGLKDVFTKEFAAFGGKITASIAYDRDQTDFRSHLTRVKETSPDGLYLAGYYSDGGLILKQAKQLALGCRMLGSTTHEDPKLLTSAGDAANGLVYPYSTGFDAKSEDATAKEFLAKFKAKYGKDPGLVAALGYDCTRLIIRAVEEREPSANGIRQYFKDAKNFAGAAGDITFDENGDVHKPIVLKSVQNGQFVKFGKN